MYVGELSVYDNNNKYTRRYVPMPESLTTEELKWLEECRYYGDLTEAEVRESNFAECTLNTIEQDKGKLTGNTEGDDTFTIVLVQFDVDTDKYENIADLCSDLTCGITNVNELYARRKGEIGFKTKSDYYMFA